MENVRANSGFSALFVLDRTDGRTDGRARHVMRPVRAAALYSVCIVAHCRRDLGMHSREIPDSAITASSAYDDRSVGSIHARYIPALSLSLSLSLCYFVPFVVLRPMSRKKCSLLCTTFGSLRIPSIFIIFSMICPDNIWRMYLA